MTTVIQEIDIDEGWHIADLKTEDDFEDALTYILNALVKIDIAILKLEIAGETNSPKYTAVMSARLYKTAALQLVQLKHERLIREKSLEPAES